jgi:membrane-associated phospholipid phosphatase
LRGGSVQVSDMFPWHSSSALFSIFEAAYFFLYCEVFIVILLYAKLRRSCVGFFGGAFFAYLFALAVYCIYPVSGPHYYVPESLAESFRSTRTANLMAQMNASYEDILAGRPTAGFAYLVALPSLHVSMAVLMQGFLAASRTHFWALLPINVLMALSTVYLGYHYLVDVVGGVALAGAILAVSFRWEMVVSLVKAWRQRVISAGDPLRV